MDDVEKSVLELVAEFSGDDPTHLRPESRIVQDLSLYGQDAVELFAAFEDRFHVDLQPLYADWKAFFPPEVPYGPSAILVVVLVLLLPVLLIPFGINPVWAWVAAVPALLIWRFGFNEWPLAPKTYRPVRIADLIAAARQKRWQPSGD